jgi:hypothetical protein
LLVKFFLYFDAFELWLLKCFDEHFIIEQVSFCFVEEFENVVFGGFLLIFILEELLDISDSLFVLQRLVHLDNYIEHLVF